MVKRMKRKIFMGKSPWTTLRSSIAHTKYWSRTTMNTWIRSPSSSNLIWTSRASSRYPCLANPANLRQGWSRISCNLQTSIAMRKQRKSRGWSKSGKLSMRFCSIQVQPRLWVCAIQLARSQVPTKKLFKMLLRVYFLSLQQINRLWNLSSRK